jgi:hypothetical protein
MVRKIHLKYFYTVAIAYYRMIVKFLIGKSLKYTHYRCKLIFIMKSWSIFIYVILYAKIQNMMFLLTIMLTQGLSYDYYKKNVKLY